MNKCLHGFEVEEAKQAGICAECTKDICRAHRGHDAWRVAKGLRPLHAPEPIPAPKPTPLPFIARPRTLQPVGSEVQVYVVMGLMVEGATHLFQREGMHDWQVWCKRKVWATYCRVDNRRGRKFIQFGEKCARLHTSLRGTDTVKKECRRFGWKYDRANGCAMTVIHEVAHAAEAHRGLKMSHSHTHKQIMREFRANYLDFLVNMFNKLFQPAEAIAANSA